MEENAPQQEQHLFDDFHNRVTQASTGKRLANYLIDAISFSVFMILISYVIIEISLDTAIFLYGNESDDFNLMSQLVWMLLYGMYMGLMEALFKGRSLGKLVTGTIAVNEDGTRISGQTALLRGLIRAVPFNGFSALGTPSYPWHDKWSKTYVVNYKDLNQQ